MYSEIRLPPVLNNLQLGSFLYYLKWQNDRHDLERIANSFKKGISNHLLEKSKPPIEEVLEFGGLKIKVLLEETEGSISYEKVLQELKKYLNHLTEEWQNQRLKKNYRTIDGSLYIDLKLVEKKIEKLKYENKKEPGIRTELKLIEPLPSIPDNIKFIFEHDYSVPSETNARYWMESNEMLCEGEKRCIGYYDESGNRVKRFKEILYEESLNLLGEEPKHLVRVPYAFDSIIFIHQLEPRERKEYSKIISALSKKAPKNITQKSNFGDIQKIKLIMLENAENKLKEQKLIDDEFLSCYEPKLINGNIFIKLDGLSKKIEDYEQEFKSSYIEQNLYINAIDRAVFVNK